MVCRTRRGSRSGNVGCQHAILELPLATWRVLRDDLPAAGGGYFRLFPPAIMRAAVRQAAREATGLPVLYFHPWEFDPDQPRLPLSRTARFRTYVGIGRAKKRLKALLARYDSIPMIEAVNELERGIALLQEFNLSASASEAAYLYSK